MTSEIEFRGDWSVRQVGAVRAGEDVTIKYSRSRLPGASKRSADNEISALQNITVFAETSPAQTQSSTQWQWLDERTIALDLTVPDRAKTLVMWFRYSNEDDQNLAWDSRFGQNFRVGVAPSFSAISAHRRRTCRPSPDGWPAAAVEAAADPAGLWLRLHQDRSIDSGYDKIVGYSPTMGAVVTVVVDYTGSLPAFDRMAATSTGDLAQYKKMAQLDAEPVGGRILYPPEPRRPCNVRRAGGPCVQPPSSTERPAEWGSLRDHFYTILRTNSDNRIFHQGMVPTKIFRHYEPEWQMIERKAIPDALGKAREERGLPPVSAEELSRARHLATLDAEELKAAREGGNGENSCPSCSEEERFMTYAARCATLALGEYLVERPS